MFEGPTDKQTHQLKEMRGRIKRTEMRKLRILTYYIYHQKMESLCSRVMAKWYKHEKKIEWIFTCLSVAMISTVEREKVEQHFKEERNAEENDQRRRKDK